MAVFASDFRLLKPLAMPPTMKFSPQKTHEITHAVTVGKGGSGGARQGSWDVPSAHSLDRTAAQISVMDQFDAATTIQQHSRGMVDRGKVGEVVRQLAPGEHTIYDLSAQIHQGKTSQPGKASNSFELRDAYATSPYGQGYGFVNNRHDQFGSTDGFNESKTSALADPKIHPQVSRAPHARLFASWSCLHAPLLSSALPAPPPRATIRTSPSHDPPHPFPSPDASEVRLHGPCAACSRSRWLDLPYA